MTPRKYGIGAVTRGADNWQPRNRTDWQRQRADGPLLPMDTPHKGWIYRVMGR